MTNSEIAQLARDKGFRANFENGGVVVWLINRKPSQMEVGRKLDIPSGLIHHDPQGALIFGSDS